MASQMREDEADPLGRLWRHDVSPVMPLHREARMDRVAARQRTWTRPLEAMAMG